MFLKFALVVLCDYCLLAAGTSPKLVWAHVRGTFLYVLSAEKRALSKMFLMVCLQKLLIIDWIIAAIRLKALNFRAQQSPLLGFAQLLDIEVINLTLRIGALSIKLGGYLIVAEAAD